jgi:hypothetical protein
MKRLMFLSGVLLLNVAIAFGQADKSSRPSPPATVSGKSAGGANVKIDYSQPSVKGRTVGGDVAPNGKVWRAGANEATILEVDKDVTIEGKKVPAGKYTLWAIPGDKESTIIINKETGQWGTQYKEAQDLVRVPVKTEKAPAFTEKLTYVIGKDGKVSLLWGDKAYVFNVK